MIVLTEESLASVVDRFMGFDEFVFDLETVYNPTEEEAERYQRVKAIPEKKRDIDDQKWLEIFELKATDPLVNEVIWIGLAGPGGAQAVIPVGHPLGRQSRPARRVKVPASQAYGLDDPRAYTKNGAISNRMVWVAYPAEFEPAPEQLDISTVVEALGPLFFSGKRIVGHNVKFDLKTMTKYFGKVPTRPYVDTIIAQHLLNERLPDYKLGSLVKRHYGKGYEKLGEKGVQNFSFNKAAKYTAQDVCYTWLLWQRFKRQLERIPSLWRFLDYEMLTYASVMWMESEGVEVDVATIARLRAEKEKEIAGIIDRLIVDYGAPVNFNPNANAQKIDLVYKKYKGKVTKRSEKTNIPSVDRESLEAVIESAADDPRRAKAGEVAQLLLDYQDESKILGTYLVGLPHRLDRRNRVHADYLLHGTETSRFSCVTGDTLVRTRRGEVPIVDVIVGDEVLTHRGRWRKVTAWLDQGERFVSQIHFASGDTLRCTEDHRLHTPRGWVYARDLEVGTEVDHASIEEVRRAAEQHREGDLVLHGRRSSNDAGSSAGARHVLSQRAEDPRRSSHPGTASACSVHPVQQGRVGGEQPDGWAQGCQASSLQGDDFVAAGVHDEPRVYRQVRAGAQGHHGEDARPGTPAAMAGGAPHRRREDQQRAGQPCAGDGGGAQHAPFAATQVAAITPFGVEHVYDITVEEDESYVANNTLSHNCREPNIQNIPRESDMRSMFMAPKGHVLLVGDYDQIELRFIAYLANDPTMLNLFISGQDIHRGTAALVLGKRIEDTTDEERQMFGKMPNFLLGYGGGAYNLHQKTGISEQHAEKVLTSYYRRFNRINPWKENVVRQARANARFDDDRRMVRAPYVETMLGRRRRLPELFWDDRKKRMAAERQAVNTITQGSASETAKLAMQQIMLHAEETGFPIRLIINVHDELVCTVPERHADEGKEVLASIMSGVRIPHTGARPLGDDLPLAVKVAVGDRWLK